MSCPAGTLAFLQHSLQQSDLNLQFEADAKGVNIALYEPELDFHHSFVCGPLFRRSRQNNQALIKACHNKQGSIHRILDLTAGWGGDSLTLAQHGQQVTLVEKNPLVFAVLQYSRQQLAQVNPTLTARLNLVHATAAGYLQASRDRESFDCIYLDPMFPAHKSSAKPAKEMQILQVLTDNLDIESCFELALQYARNRVVVKRPAKASCLDYQRPDIVYREKTIRFDVYLTA